MLLIPYFGQIFPGGQGVHYYIEISIGVVLYVPGGHGNG